jgi:lipopolysaccharide biosynthesis glycosyltransferase
MKAESLSNAQESEAFAARERDQTMKSATVPVPSFVSAPIQIALGCDEAFVPHAAVVIRSILHNSPKEDHLVFNVVTTGLSEKTLVRLSKVAESDRSCLRIHALNASNLKNLPPCHLTLNAYLRIFLPELLPDLERVIYLDCDLLPIASLRPLWETRLRPGAIAAACEDIYSIYAKLGNEDLIAFFDALGMKTGESYFNSGVILMDLDGWRDQSVTEKACNWGTENPELIRHADQDILNVILKGSVHYLPLKWNLSIHMIDRANRIGGATDCTTDEKAATEDPAIIHFVGHHKGNSLETPMPYQRQYLRRLAETPWAGDFIPAQSGLQKYIRIKRLTKRFLLAKRAQLTDLLGKAPPFVDGIVRVDRSPERS